MVIFKVIIPEALLKKTVVAFK